MTIAPGERLVIDASIAVKWVVTEVDSDKAELLLGRSLIAPDLMFAECANVLWKKVRRGEMTDGEAAIAAQTLEEADLTVISTRPYLARIVAIAAELDHPAYDASYLAVAEALGLRFVTADERLIRVLQAGSRFRQFVVSIADVR